MNNIFRDTIVTDSLILNDDTSNVNTIKSSSFKTNAIKINPSKSNNTAITSAENPKITINNSKILLSIYNQKLFDISTYGNPSETELFNIKSTNSDISVGTVYLPKASADHYGGIKIDKNGIYF